MASVAPTPSATAVTGVSTGLPALQPGDVIKALVLALIDDTLLRLKIPGGTLDVKTNVPLAPGTRVALSVEGTQAQPKLVLTPLSNQPGRPAIQAPTPAPTPTPATDAPPALQAVLRAAGTIVRDAATRQGGLAPLYADLEAVLGQSNPSVPAPVAAAARQLLTLRLDTGAAGAVTASDVKIALARSGLAIPRTDSARTDSAPTDPEQTDAARTDAALPSILGAGDIKSALVSLRQTLKTWLDTPHDVVADSEPVSTTEATSPAPRQMASEPKSMPRPVGPMPPYRDAPTVPQAPAAATISGAAPPRELALHLLGETDAAMARQTLLQIASLPDDPAANRVDARSDRMTFDIPLSTPQGTAVAQLRVERDGGNRSEQQSAPGWRASFSIDLAAIGPVHVRIALNGQCTTVTMNAERPESAALLSDGLPILEAGLRGADLEPGELRCNAGAARASSAAPGLFVDQAT